MRTQLVSLLVAMVAFVSGCQDSSRAPAVGQLPTGSFKRQWTAQLDLSRDQTKALYLREDTLFFYSQDNQAWALDTGTGHVQYAAQVAHPDVKVRPPVVLNKRVIFPTNTTLEIYDRTGRKSRSLDLQRPMRSGAVGAGDNLYIGIDENGTGRVLAVDLEKPYGFTRWELMTFGGIAATPALFQNVLFVGSEDGKVYAVNQERDAVWSLPGNAFTAGGPIRADLKADEFGVYVASMDSKLYCLDRFTGKIKWQYYAGAPLDASPIVTGDTVYQMVPGVGMVAIAKTEGAYNRKPRWIAADIKQILSQDDKYVYAARRDNTVAALDKQTGQVAFQSKGHPFSIFATNTKDATIYAATPEGEVAAVVPVLKPGVVGEMVLLPRPVEPLAMAR